MLAYPAGRQKTGFWTINISAARGVRRLRHPSGDAAAVNSSHKRARVAVQAKSFRGRRDEPIVQRIRASLRSDNGSGRRWRFAAAPAPPDPSAGRRGDKAQFAGAGLQSLQCSSAMTLEGWLRTQSDLPADRTASTLAPNAAKGSSPLLRLVAPC